MLAATCVTSSCSPVSFAFSRHLRAFSSFAKALCWADTIALPETCYFRSTSASAYSCFVTARLKSKLCSASATKAIVSEKTSMLVEWWFSWKARTLLQMLSTLWYKTILVASNPSGTFYRPLGVWLVSRDAFHLAPPADNHTAIMSFRTALLDAVCWKMYIFFLACTYHANRYSSFSKSYGQRQTTVSDGQFAHHHRAPSRLLTATFRDDSNVFVTHVLVINKAHLLTICSLLLLYIFRTHSRLATTSRPYHCTMHLSSSKLVFDRGSITASRPTNARTLTLSTASPRPFNTDVPKILPV